MASYQDSSPFFSLMTMNRPSEPPSFRSDSFRMRVTMFADCWAELVGVGLKLSSCTTSMGAFIHLRTYRSSYSSFSMMTWAQQLATAPSVPGRRFTQMSASLPRFVWRGSTMMCLSARVATSTVVRQLSS